LQHLVAISATSCKTFIRFVDSCYTVEETESKAKRVSGVPLTRIALCAGHVLILAGERPVAGIRRQA
jgi:hypothetical protein